jgi:anti-anti-sigma factor
MTGFRVESRQMEVPITVCRFRRKSAMTNPLQDVSVEQPREGAAVVVFSGEHDVATAETVAATLESLVEQNELVVADFSEAEFVDSSTLNALVKAARSAQQRGTRFRVQLGTAAIVERAFQLSGVLEVLDRAPTREEALRNGGSAL